jgi:hypothetical protein
VAGNNVMEMIGMKHTTLLFHNVIICNFQAKNNRISYKKIILVQLI